MTTAAKVPSDIAIAQAATLRPIADVAAELGLADDEVELYGKYKAKIALRALAARKPKGRLVLVTGISPTPAGEGKSTVTVGVTQALRRTAGNQTKAAALLGLNRDQIRYRIEKFGLDKPAAP